jgi:hypothetical protein
MLGALPKGPDSFNMSPWCFTCRFCQYFILSSRNDFNQKVTPYLSICMKEDVNIRQPFHSQWVPASDHGVLAQPWATSCGIHGGQNGTGIGLFSQNFFALPLQIISPLLHTCLSWPLEVCSIPEQAAHYHWSLSSGHQLWSATWLVNQFLVCWPVSRASSVEGQINTLFSHSIFSASILTYGAEPFLRSWQLCSHSSINMYLKQFSGHLWPTRT